MKKINNCYCQLSGLAQKVDISFNPYTAVFTQTREFSKMIIIFCIFIYWKYIRVQNFINVTTIISSNIVEYKTLIILSELQHQFLFQILVFFKEQNFKINVCILEQICLKYYLQVITLSFFPNKNLSTTFKIIYYFLANIYIFSLISPIN